MRGRVQKFLPLLAWMTLVTWLSSRPMPRVPGTDWPGSDKVVHLAAYAVGGVLAHVAIPSGIAAAGVVSAFGATDEWHQAHTPGRSPDVRDWLADTAGALLGAGWAAWRAGRRSCPRR